MKYFSYSLLKGRALYSVTRLRRHDLIPGLRNMTHKPLISGTEAFFLSVSLSVSSACVWHFSTSWEPTKTDVGWQLSWRCQTSFLTREQAGGRAGGRAAAVTLQLPPHRHALQISLTSPDGGRHQPQATWPLRLQLIPLILVLVRQRGGHFPGEVLPHPPKESSNSS